MPQLPTNIGEAFANKTLKKFWGKAISPDICSTDYEPIAALGGTDRVHILSFLNNPNLTAYTVGTDMSTQEWMGDVESDLLLDQKYYYDFQIDDLDKFEAYVNDLDSNLIEAAAGVLQQQIDSYILGTFLPDTKVGHRVGSNYIRGSGAITAAGAMTMAQAGSGEGTGNIPSSAAGRNMGVSFDSGATWYRISARTSSVACTVTDWNGSTYTGGAQTEKVIRFEAGDPVALTSSTIYAKITTLASVLTTDYIPTTDRWLVVHPTVGAYLRQASELIPAVPTAYENVVEKGIIGYISGFKVYESPLVRGDNSGGYYCPAGHKSFITFAHTWKESRVVKPDARFATRYQGLNVYGAKVPTERRKAGAYLFCTVS